VVASARRTAPLEELIAESPQPALGLAAGCDVTAAEAGAGLVRAATAFLEGHGGLDTVIYAAGTAPLGALSSTTAGQWQEPLATNLVGAALVVAEALPELRRRPAGRSVVALLSSHIVGDPWPGLGAYAASKAGVNELARGLRAEEPSVRTLRISVGPTVTSFADGWDADVATTYLTRWFEEGQLRHDVLTPDETAGAILRALDDPASPDDLTVIGAEAPSRPVETA
jgi:NAD(P)-dependent dehydrogenase (short-subunit alcohol dehydrogenase family)